MGTSVWRDTVSVAKFPALSGKHETEIAVIGAGIAGLTVAYYLAQEGKKVTVVDDGEIGSGETGNTTAHLVNAFDDRFFEIERPYDRKRSRLTADSHTAAIDAVEKIVAHEKIDCDFERLDGYLFPNADDSVATLKKELKAAQRAGLDDVELLERSSVSKFTHGPVLRFPKQAQFHPLKYLHGLARAITKKGNQIFVNTHIKNIKNGSPLTLTAEGGTTIRADKVVVATNAPIFGEDKLYAKQAPYRTYVIGITIPKNSVPKALYWDTGHPYHYVRLYQDAQLDHDILVVGGEDHKTGQADDGQRRYEQLKVWSDQHFPAGDVAWQWSGQVLEPADGLAFIGLSPSGDNVYVVTGDSGNGMTHGTIAGPLITDLLLGRSNPWAELYSPSRSVMRHAVKETVKENVNVVKELIKGYAKGGGAQSVDTIPAGQGAILQKGRSKVAVFRDKAGKLHTLSAKCPHMGCIVAWNSTEQSWDCPCHGSRYDTTGMVLNGPTIQGLEPAEKK
jgi:glycine/D-amino acid oxidase-like deaminating enzyme/nitrite reductase/ring-hydroxylating ferredoxin subunit